MAEMGAGGHTADRDPGKPAAASSPAVPRHFDAGWKAYGLMAVLCLAAYLPAVNNGFVSDDFIFLERTRELQGNALRLLEIPPEIFRATTYLAFMALKGAFGYAPAFFYAFTILLHCINSLLLWRLLIRITGQEEMSLLAAVLFAVFQNPQEAVMWLGGMHESLLGIFVLATLLLWLKESYFAAACCFFLGLFSKESAPVTLLLLPIVQLCAQRKIRLRPQYAYFLAPLLIFAGTFLYTARDNTLISHGYYGFGPAAILVWINSLHRLMFPWFYLAGAVYIFSVRRKPSPLFWGAAAWTAVSLLPYVFLTYQNHVPSRHEHLASMGLAWALATLVRDFRPASLANIYVALFVVMNISYLYWVKDRQFEERAAPTTLLIEELRSTPPGKVRLVDFPLNPWIAKMSTRLASGWEPGMIVVEELGETCDRCPQLRWDAKTRRYSRP